MSSRAVMRVVPGLVMLAFAPPSGAQIYNFDPANPPDKAMNVYFGSTKDTDGTSLAGVTVTLDIDVTTYVMVTDDDGRFKIRIPKGIAMSQVKFTCSRPGYVLYRASKRPPPDKSQSPIQADCVLKRRTGTTE